MDELFDSSRYIKVRHPDDIDVYEELMDSPVEEESVHPLYHCYTTGEQTGELSHRYIPPNSIYQWTELYERRNHTYVRYCYSLNKVTGSKKTIHIPGGNHKNSITKKRWIAVEEMIVRGKTPEEITKIIAQWS